MERRIILWIVIGILFLVALFIVSKTGNTNAVNAASQTASASRSAAQSAAASYGGMVGGC